MKRVLLAILLIFVFSSVGTAAIKDSPDGFRGIKWGDPPSKLGARNKVGADRFLSLYEKKEEKMTIGAADLTTIRYVFLQDSLLMAIIIKTNGDFNSNQLRDTAIARYGEPAENTQDDCIWFDVNVVIGYKYNKYEDIAELVIYSKKIFDKYSAVKQEASEQGAKDF